MRWKFARDNSAYDEKIRQIDAWWREFEAKAEKLDAFFTQKERWNLPQWVDDHLKPVDKRLAWEFGPGLNGGHRLVITPESNFELRPIVDTILERAPKLDGWEFYGARPPGALDFAVQKIEANGLPELTDTRVIVGRGEDNRVALIYCSPNIRDPEDEAAHYAAFFMTEGVLGERILDTWIGEITVDNAVPPSELAVPLSKLPDAVSEQISRIHGALPDKPVWQLPEDGEWRLWRLEPEEADDYPQQDDLIVAKSMLPDMWMAAHSGNAFRSERFSRHGEVFCYLKIDGSSDEASGSFADKAEIEEALDTALKASETGAWIGGGQGRRYSYIDFALSDPERGIRNIVERLREGNISKRSWILFFDADYKDEWVGIWDDSPPPPGH